MFGDHPVLKAKMNPNAKIILTVRDSPEAWSKSASDTICRIVWLKIRKNGSAYGIMYKLSY